MPCWVHEKTDLWVYIGQRRNRGKEKCEYAQSFYYYKEKKKERKVDEEGEEAEVIREFTTFTR